MKKAMVKRCTRCKGTRFKGTKHHLERKVDGRTFETEVDAAQCKTCGETYFDAKAGELFELMIAARLAEMGASSGEAFRFMRKTVGMTAEKLGELFAFAPETISRWETAKRDVDRNAVIALGSIVLDQLQGHDTTIRRLKALRSPTKGKKGVYVDLYGGDEAGGFLK